MSPVNNLNRLDRVALSILKVFFSSTLDEGYLGDIGEEFADMLQTRGSRHARLWLWRHTLMAMPRALMQNLAWGLTLLANHFKVASRNIRKHRSFSVINIAGMTLGLSIALMIVQLLVTFISYDHFHEHKDRLYQVNTIKTTADARYETACAPLPLAEELVSRCPAIDTAVRVKDGFHSRAVANAKILNMRFLMADAGFFQIFSYPLKYGDAATALERPNSIVLTQEIAAKFFGSANPMGEVFRFDEYGDFTVTGVMEEHRQHQSHMNVSSLASMSSLPALVQAGKEAPCLDDWETLPYNYLYVTTIDNKQETVLTEALEQLTEERYRPEDEAHFTFAMDKVTDLTPGDRKYYSTRTVPWVVVYSFIIVAAMILLTAGFNYSNLSLARILTRAREVGIRKVSGGRSSQLFMQFISEAVLIALLSLVAAWLLYRIMLIPLFYSLLPEFKMIFHFTDNWRVAGGFVLISIAMGMVAGGMPAFYMTRFKILDALKDLKGAGGGIRVRLRKVMITAQFALTLVFLFSALAVLQQAEYTRNLPLGFNQKGLYSIPLHGINAKHFVQKLETVNAIQSATVTDGLPGVGQYVARWMRRKDSNDSLRVKSHFADSRFFETMGLKLLAGNRPEDRDGSTELQIYCDVMTIKRLGYDSPHDALNQILSYRNGTVLRIAGVLAPYVSESVTKVPEPSAIIISDQADSRVVVRIDPAVEHEVRPLLARFWEESESAEAFYFRSYQDLLDESALEISIIFKLLALISVMAVTVCLLGIIGIADYSARSRIKEIGIRKVLGARQGQLLFTLSLQFLGLIALGGLLGLPVAYQAGRYVITLWSNNPPDSWMPLLGGFLLLLVMGGGAALSQLMRAARISPVKSLKYE